MKYFILCVWILGSGLTFSGTISDRYARCGNPVTVDIEGLALAMAWPILAVTAVTIEKGSVKVKKCESQTNE